MTCTITQPYLKDDREAILGLWERNLPESTPARYAWLYESGPADSWISRDGDVPIGSVGLMRRTMDVFGETRPAGQSVDLNVDRRHRLGGVALSLQRALIGQVEQGSIDLAFGFPNSQSEPIIRRAGYRVIGELGRWAKPLASEPMLPGWLRFRPIRKAAAFGLDAALRLLCEERAPRCRDGMRVEVTDRFDARFDQLWQATRDRPHVAGHRNAEYLTWRFVHAPGACHRVFYLADAHGDLLAYLVYGTRDGVGYVSDFLFLTSAHFELLLAEFTRLMRRQRARAIVTIFSGAPRVARCLARLGFRRRPSTWKIMVLADRARLGADVDRLLDLENWYLTRADVDTDF